LKAARAHLPALSQVETQRRSNGWRLAVARTKCDEGPLSHYLHNLWSNLSGEFTFWTFFGLVANLLFASRFVIQWYVSERLKRSVIPVQFWYLSIAGSFMMLIYAIYIGKVPLILGFLFPTIIYIRNLMLIRKHQRDSKLTASDEDRFPVATSSEKTTP
jgi:lipid-A-disaccharide synthase-like uncharacterized protein